MGIILSTESLQLLYISYMWIQGLLYELLGRGNTGCIEDMLGTRSYTVEPLNKGRFGANSFVPCREVVPISEVK